MLPGHARATVYVQDSSTFNFNQQFQDNLDRALTRNRRSSISLQKTFFGLTAQALADSTDTIFDSTENFIRRRHLPSLTLTQPPRSLGKKLGLVLAFDSAAERLQQGNQARIDDYKRFDVHPRLSRPFSLSFLQVNPEVQYRYTHYDASLGARDKLVGPPLDRQYFEGSLDLRGPTFSRVFSTPDNFYSERYKHVIGPEVNWTYRSKVEDFDAIPRFDYYDVILGTNQLSYALVQRFYAKRPGRSGKLEAYEFFNWRVGQTYYVDIADGQNDFDPNYSSAAFDATGKPSHLSPIQSRMRFRPTTAFSTNFDVEYGVNFHSVKSLGLSTNYNGSRFVTQAAWSRGKRLAPGRTLLNRSLLRGSAAFFVRHVARVHPAREIVVLDKLTYAGRRENLAGLAEHPDFRFVQGDIADPQAVADVLPGCDYVVNFAAETHVDRSLYDAGSFIMTDVYGTFVLLEAARRAPGLKLFVQISTDEVYGSVESGSSS